LRGSFMGLYLEDDCMDELIENNFEHEENRWKAIESILWKYVPTYIPEMELWGVETCHRIEIGNLSYVADQFCWDSVVYHFYDKYHKTVPNHVHGDLGKGWRRLFAMIRMKYEELRGSYWEKT